MSVLLYLHTALLARLAEVRHDGERGDSPVPTAVIIFGLVAAALAVTVAVSQSVSDWMDAIPGPGGGGAEVDPPANPN